MISPDIFTFIKEQENRFQTDDIRVADNWNWNLRNHVQMIFHLKNSRFFTGENDWLRAFKNIMEPLLNLSYWAEDIEVKDVFFYTEEDNNRVLSFLLKKYYEEVFVRKYDLDVLFDEIAESDLDYGGVLVQKTNTPKPEVIDLMRIAFCDQTDILNGVLAFKHDFNSDALRKMAAYGWGDEKNGATSTIEEVILYAEAERMAAAQSNITNKVPSKNIEIYILHGSLPEHYLKDNNNIEDYYNQIQIVALYPSQDNKYKGCVLYRKLEEESNLKFFTCKKVYGRALGRGEGESLLHPQIWTNFLTIHKTKLLEAASKVPLYTDDPSYTNKNRIMDMENLEVTTIEDNKRIYQVPTAAPANIQLIERSVNEWFENAQLVGSAYDPLLGKQPVSGTTFRGQERTVIQGKGLHERRRGQRAKFIEEIYRDWIIPSMKKEILKGTTFLASLSGEEMMWIVERLATYRANRDVVQDVLEGKPVRDIEAQKQVYQQDYMKNGNKQIIEILKGEFEDIEIKMGISVASKQKEIAGLSDKILSIFQFIFANPAGFQQAMQLPGMSKAFQDILEYSGISQADFAAIATAPALPAPQGISAPTPSPVQPIPMTNAQMTV